MVAATSTAIGSQAFAVSTKVRQLFIDKNKDYRQAFTDWSGDQWLADIYSPDCIDLTTAGIARIYGGNRRTYSESGYFFSQRRQG